MKTNKTKNLFFLILILLFIPKIQATPNRGLKQCGNTCFMNAAMQCLCSITGFNDTLIENKTKYAPNSISQKYITAIEEMRKTGVAYNPQDFAKAVRNQIFKEGLTASGRHQDAAEFIQNLFSNHLIGETDLAGLVPGKEGTQEKLEKDLLVYRRFVKGAANNDRQAVLDKISASDYLNFLINDLSSPYFNLWVFNKKTKEITWEPILKVFVEAEDVTFKTLSECLNNFDTEFAFDGLPKTLIISFNRFMSEFNSVTKNLKSWKFDAPVSFPLEGLDLKKFLTKEAQEDRKDKSSKYNLIGVVCHSGSLDGGHYIAYAKDRDSNDWHYYNDSSVNSKSSTDIANIANQTTEKGTPYILFYQLDESATSKKLIEVPENSSKEIWEYTESVEQDLKDKLGNIGEALKTIPVQGKEEDQEFYKKAALLTIDGAGADLCLLEKKDETKFKEIKNKNSELIRKLFGPIEKAPYLYRLMKTYQSKLVVDKFLNDNGDGLSADGQAWKEFYTEQNKKEKKTLYELAGL